jgi:3D (Asp-Asp-Asp) domain-containing protein
MKKQQLLVLLISLNLGLGLIFSVAAAPTKTLMPAPAPLITITAYSSTPEQTDDTPFITASGHLVEDGIVACNFLAFNTKIKLPELYGEKIFTVKDRMAKKNSHKIDIWFPSTEAAKNFGVQKTRVEIVES